MFSSQTWMHILNSSLATMFLCKERASIAKRPKSTIIYVGGQANTNGRMVWDNLDISYLPRRPYKTLEIQIN